MTTPDPEAPEPVVHHGRPGRRWGEVRHCPSCNHQHAVGSTCRQCSGCRDPERRKR